MQKNYIKWLLPVILFISLNCLQAQTVTKGYVDLSDFNFQEGKSVKLDGQWEFYWKQFLTPESNYPKPSAIKNYIQVPGGWTADYGNIENISLKGYATYRLTMKLLPGQYFLYFPAIFTSSKIWINDDLITEIGRVDTAGATVIPKYVNFSIPLEMDDEEVVIIIQAANFHHSKGGIRTSIEIGHLSDLHGRTILKLAKDLTIIILALMIGLFHLIVSVTHKKEKHISNFIFGIFAFMFSIRLFIINKDILYFLNPAANWFLITRLEWLIAASTGWLGLLFIKTKYSEESKGRLIKIVLELGLVLSLLTILLNTFTMTRLLIPIFLYTGIVIVVIVYIILRAYFSKKRDSIILLAGLVLIFFTVITDIFLIHKYDYNFNITTYGFLAFLIAYTYNLVLKLIEISKSLNDYQDNLENIIYERTQQLEESKVLLEKKIHETLLSQSKLRRINKELSEQIEKNRETQNALMLSEKRFRELSDLLPEVVYETDFELNFTYINEAALHKFGYSKDEFLNGINAKNIVSQSSLETLLKNTYSPDHDMATAYNEYTFIRKDGSTFCGLINGIQIHANGRTVGFRGIVIDLTHIKESEQEILKLQNYLTNIINSMPSVMIGINKNFEITLWNREAEKSFNISEKEAIHKNLFALCPVLMDSREMIKMSMESLNIRVMKINDESGERAFHHNVTIYPLKNEQDGAVIRIDDITEQIKMEELIIQSEKMLSVGGLAAGMAHEINNPLAGMIQNAYVISNRFKPGNIQKVTKNEDHTDIILKYFTGRNLNKLLSLVIDSGHRAAKIVDNMLSFAKQGKLVFEKENINRVLDETLDLATSDYDLSKKFDFKKIKIHKNYKEPIKDISCEKSKLQQVFYNLIKNAAEATHLKLEKMKNLAEEYTPEIKIRTSETEDNITVEIMDNGPGVPESIKSRIFEPFFTTKDVNSGTGLGLSVSYFIITKNHNGSMQVESVVDGGTKFIITLPKTKVL
ncbi:MAG: PAS domain S-box protein [Candidatus Marinimicrobia bacterium]|nr:PAS domain S-box protein [Candidatus Neomarinimicrobiota bacterium]